MCSLNTVAPVSNWIINGIFYCSYLFICLSTTEEDNCIQYLSLFNLYTSSFIYSSKSFYFRYGDFRDLKKKIFLLAFTPCYSSLSSRYFLHTGRFLMFRNLLLVADAPAGNRSYKVHQISVPTRTIEPPTRTDWTEHGWVYLNY